MNRLENTGECQIPCLPQLADGYARIDVQPIRLRLKRLLARPWNYYAKRVLKQYLRLLTQRLTLVPETAHSQQEKHSSTPGWKAGDKVRVKSREAIRATLDRWNELKGCSFLDYMWQYCGTRQRILHPMTRFLDERDYRVKKCKGIVLLEGVICRGTPVFGPCDRCCHLFWREEWLEKAD
jgi:hypothetical protein